MFAVIKTGGKQYRVAAEDVITIEKLAGEAGETITFGEVLLVGDADETKVGAPLLSGVSVTGTVVEQTAGTVVLEVPRSRAGAVVGNLEMLEAVSDVSLADPPLEETLRDLYRLSP